MGIQPCWITPSRGEAFKGNCSISFKMQPKAFTRSTRKEKSFGPTKPNLISWVILRTNTLATTFESSTRTLR